MDAHKLPCSPSTTQCSLTSLVSLYFIYLFFLQTYAAQEGPYQAKAQMIYKELRRNVIANVVKVGCFTFQTFFFPHSHAVQIRNTNVPDIHGNNTMLLQAKDEEGMLRFYAFVNISFTPPPL